MANKVTTTATCPRCGKEDVRDGAHEIAWPVGWAWVCVRRQDDKRDTTEIFDGVLCPDCWGEVTNLLPTESSGG